MWRITPANSAPVIWRGAVLHMPGANTRALPAGRRTPYHYRRKTCVRAGIHGLGRVAYNLDIIDFAFPRAKFETVGRPTAEERSHALHYPRDFASLPAVIEAILNHLEAVEHDTE
jgi:hypothetical protein